MSCIYGVVSAPLTSDLTESYFGKLARGHFPRLKPGQIRQIGNNIFQFAADNLLGSKAILGLISGHKVNMNTSNSF